MITITTDIATTMTPAVMPALLAEVSSIGAYVSGRRSSAGCVAVNLGVRVPAFPKGALGVRAWSPPV